MIHAAFSAPARLAGYATIALSGHQSAQGPILHHFSDGRVQIDSGNGILTGHPLNADIKPPRNRTTANWLPLFAGMH